MRSNKFNSFSVSKNKGEEKIEYRPIGIIHTPFKKLEGMPIQPVGAKGIQGRVEVFPEYETGLQDLNGFSHIVLLYHFHRSRGFNLLVVPFLDSHLRGVFATRAPKRPNPIGLSVVKLLRVEGRNLYVENVDILDGTPLLDIKPYLPDFNEKTRVKIGWLKQVRKAMAVIRSDKRFL